jgi:hypothetical protein
MRDDIDNNVQLNLRRQERLSFSKTSGHASSTEHILYRLRFPSSSTEHILYRLRFPSIPTSMWRPTLHDFIELPLLPSVLDSPSWTRLLQPALVHSSSSYGFVLSLWSHISHYCSPHFNLAPHCVTLRIHSGILQLQLEKLPLQVSAVREAMYGSTILVLNIFNC